MNSSNTQFLTMIQAKKNTWVNWSEVWNYRELIGFLAIRDIKVKYKQASLGVLWVLAQPVFTMLTYTFLFGRVAKLDSEGLPYSIFSFAGLVPWAFFSSSLGKGSNSLVGGGALLSKVYFPRIIIPLASLIAGLLDYALALLSLFILMAFYGLEPQLNWLVGLPLLTVWIFTLAFGMSCWLGSLNVKYRDVGHLLPFLTQVWMFATPVVYSIKVLPEKYLAFLYLNPMVGIVEAFRGLLFQRPVDLSLVFSSLILTMVVFLFGVRYFSKTERTFADII